MNKQRMFYWGWLLWFAVALHAAAQPAVQPLAGRDYRLLNPPQSVETPNKIEVIEFFWYGCPHCAALEPSMREWVKKQATDVLVRRVPVAYRDSLIPHQRLFYALDALGVEDALRQKIFDAIHRDKNPLTTPEAMTNFLAQQGVDRKKFLEIYNSFAVQSKVRRATQLAEAYGVDGVPMIGVNGKYLVSAQPNHFAVIDALISQERVSLKPAPNAATPSSRKP